MGSEAIIDRGCYDDLAIRNLKSKSSPIITSLLKPSNMGLGQGLAEVVL